MTGMVAPIPVVAGRTTNTANARRTASDYIPTASVSPNRRCERKSLT